MVHGVDSLGLGQVDSIERVAGIVQVLLYTCIY